MTVRTKQHPNVSSPTGLAHLSNDLRLACMRISRRVRFECDRELPPHQFSCSAASRARPRTPQRARRHREGQRPEHDAHDDAGLVERGLVARADDPTDGRQVILSLTPEGAGPLKRHPPAPRRVDARAPRAASPTTSGSCSRAPPTSWTGGQRMSPTFHSLVDPQLPHLRLAARSSPTSAPGWAASPRTGSCSPSSPTTSADGPRRRDRPAVPALPAPRAVGRHDRRPLPQAPHPASSPRPPCSPVARCCSACSPSPASSQLWHVYALALRSRASRRPSTTRPGRRSSSEMVAAEHLPNAVAPQQRLVQPRPPHRPGRGRPASSRWSASARRSSSTRVTFVFVLVALLRMRHRASCARRPGRGARARSARACATSRAGPTSCSSWCSSSCSARSA